MGLTCFYKSSIYHHYHHIRFAFVFPLKREGYVCISLLMYVFFSPLCAVPHAAGSKAYGTHTRKVTEEDSDCHTVQIYMYVRRETAAISQLLLSKIVCKACYCAPVKISESPREITKLELSRRCKKRQQVWLVSKKWFWEQKYFCIPALLELQT